MAVKKRFKLAPTLKLLNTKKKKINPPIRLDSSVG
jgi:hypothetical protein